MGKEKVIFNLSNVKRFLARKDPGAHFQNFTVDKMKNGIYRKHNKERERRI